MDSYKVSLIIPCYNGEKNIHALIDTIKRQTIGFENIEVLFVDDCSKDKSRALLHDYEEKNENVRLICMEENSGGAARPRNVGIENAKSRYVMFADVDDLITLDGIEKLYNAAIKYDADFIKSNELALMKGKYYKLNNICEHVVKQCRSDMTFTNMCSNTMIVSREFLINNNIRFRESTLGEDTLFVVELMTRTEKNFYVIPAYTRIYCINSASVTHNVLTENLISFIDLLDEMMDMCIRLNAAFKRDVYKYYIPVYYCFIFQLKDFNRSEVTKVLKRLHITQKKYRRYAAAVPSIYRCIYVLIDKKMYGITYLLLKIMHIMFDTKLFIKLFRFKNFKEYPN